VDPRQKNHPARRIRHHPDLGFNLRETSSDCLLFAF
jgi:hypothetical protein